MPKKLQRAAKKRASAAVPQQAPATPPARGIPPVRTEQEMRQFLSLLDHYFEAGALSEESYFEVKGEALKKLAHLKKQKAFGGQNAQQPDSNKQELQGQPGHRKKLYDAAERAMDAAVRAAGSKLLGIRHGGQFAGEEQAENMRQFSQQPQREQMRPVQASGFEGASIAQLKKAKGDAEAMLEFIEESFNEGGLSEENYRSTRANKMRELSKIKSHLASRVAEYEGDDATDSDEGDSEGAEEEENAGEGGELDEAGLNVFGSRKTRALAPKSKARKMRGNEFDDDLAEHAEKTSAQEEAEREEIPESFPSFSQLMEPAQNSAPEFSEGTEEELRDAQEPRLSRGERGHSAMELELLGALGLKKNKHALQELENTVTPGEGESYNFYGAKTVKAKSAKSGDDLAGSFTPESIAQDEQKERQNNAAMQQQDAAGAFLSKIKSFIPGTRQAGAQQSDPTGTALAQPQQASAQSFGRNDSEETAMPTDSSASTMKILMELEKLKAKTETLGEMRNALDERLGHIQESLGELRSMTFARESGQKELEAKVEKYLDLVENLEPQKFMKEFDKRDKELASQGMRLEKMEAASADLARIANSTKSLLESMGSLKNLSNVNKEVSEKLSKMDSTVNRAQKTADDIDRAFVEVGNKLEEFSIYAGKQEVLGQTVQDLVEMLETTNKKFDAYVGKDDLDKYGKQLENVNLSISELRASKVLKEDGRDLPPQTRNLLKQKESIEFLLSSIEEDFDAREITAQDYEIAKRANLQKLSQVEKALREEYDQITDSRREEELKATQIAKNVCVEPGVMKAHEGFEHGETPSAGAADEANGGEEKTDFEIPGEKKSTGAKILPAKQPLKKTGANKKGFFEQAFSAIPNPAPANSTGMRVEGEKTAQEPQARIAQPLAIPLHSQSLSDSLMQALNGKMPKQKSGMQAPPQSVKEQTLTQALKPKAQSWREKRKTMAQPVLAQATWAKALFPVASAQNEKAGAPGGSPSYNFPLLKQEVGQQQEPVQRIQPNVPMQAKTSPDGEKPVFDLKKLLELRLAMQNGGGDEKTTPFFYEKKGAVDRQRKKAKQHYNTIYEYNEKAVLGKNQKPLAKNNRTGVKQAQNPVAGKKPAGKAKPASATALKNRTAGTPTSAKLALLVSPQFEGLPDPLPRKIQYTGTMKKPVANSMNNLGPQARKAPGAQTAQKMRQNPSAKNPSQSKAQAQRIKRKK